MQTVKTALFILICLLLFVACGNKGPLYLPDQTPTAKLETTTKNEMAEEEEKEGLTPR